MELWWIAVVIIILLVLSYAVFLMSLWGLLKLLFSVKKQENFNIFSDSE